MKFGAICAVQMHLTDVNTITGQQFVVAVVQ